jgi:hypothetical protein
MKHALNNLFGTPVYVGEVDNLKLVQEEVGFGLSRVKYTNSQAWNFQSVKTTPLNGDVISEFSMRNFEQSIDAHIARYCELVNFRPRPYNKRLSWLTNNSKGGYTHVHNHTSTDISGAYYYQTEKGNGNFFFMNPNLAATTSYVFERVPSYTEVEPRVGMILLFPSYILHGVKTNEMDTDRISLSFSVIYNRG